MAASPSALASWLSRPLLVVGVVSGLVGVGWVAYVAVAVVPPLLGGDFGYAGDFVTYYEAAERFSADAGALYDDLNYMYPPPSIVLFLLLGGLPPAAAYLAMAALSFAALAACAGLLVRLLERSGAPLGRAERVAVGVVLFASAPFFQTVKMGQVAALVLLACLVFLYGLPSRPRTAGVALALGFWLKLYPLGLAVLGVRARARGRFALGLVLGTAGVVLILAALVPLSLYRDYLAVLAHYADLSNVAGMNQGLPAVLARLSLPFEAFTTYADRPLGAVPRLLTAAVALGLGAGIVAAWWRGRLRDETAGVALLALLPVVSTYGWEHTYLLAVPLVVWALVAAARAGRGIRVAAVAAGLVYLIPKPPEAVLARSFAWGPRGLHDLFHARFLLVALALLAALLWQAWRAPALRSSPPD